MTYTALPMKTLWQQLAQAGSPVNACPLVADTAAGLREMPFSVAFAAAVEKAVTDGTLRPPEEAVLRAFGRECGQYDLPRQTAQVKHCLCQLTELRTQAREEAVSRGQICRVAGAAGGAALALLLL